MGMIESLSLSLSIINSTTTQPHSGLHTPAMSNPLYDYTAGSYGGANTSIYTRRSASDSYLSGDTAARISGMSITTRTHSYDPPVVDAAPESLYDGFKRSSAESLYHQSLLAAHNKIGQNEACYSPNSLSKRPRYESTSHLPIYPQRPGEKDCAFYMQTRTCKFGVSCKFDHPIWVPEGGIPDWKEVIQVIPVPSEALPERPGEVDCPFFLKTQRCKFGIKCRFNHPKDKLAPPVSLEDGDISVLPERPSEPLCTFYMKTGKCKFGTTCKFHHPKEVQISPGKGDGAELQNKVYADAIELQTTFTPALLHNTKGLPIRPGEEDCPFYLKTGSCKYGATCRYSHPDRYSAIAPTLLASPSAHINNGLVGSTVSLLPMLGLGTTIYPQRPGQLECDFYMKTGICKFGITCKFHHPINRSNPQVSATESQHENVKLTLAGLPRREGAIHCPYYMKTGTCKYGATCKFDHPPPGEVMGASSPAVGEETENDD